MKHRKLTFLIIMLFTTTSCEISFNTKSSSSSLSSFNSVSSSSESISSNISSSSSSSSIKSSSSSSTSQTIYTVDPYAGISSSTFYKNYSPATSYIDSYYRSLHGFLSGSNNTNYSNVSSNFSSQPTKDNKYVKYYTSTYEDNNNTYVIYDYQKNVVNKIYKGGGYITPNEVACYIQGFNSLPSNYSEVDKTKGDSSTIWGSYVRYNHSYFSNDTSKYPNEPELPLSGKRYDYYEIDIGGANYSYGGKRGTFRIVYSRYYYGTPTLVNLSEMKIFYTYDHYYNFQEFLNYNNGWGKKFGYQNNTVTSYPEVEIETI